MSLGGEAPRRNSDRTTFYAVGHIGWDCARLAPNQPTERLPGGALMHFAAGFCFVRRGIRMLSLADRSEFGEPIAILEENGADLSQIQFHSPPIEFDLDYDLSKSQELLSLRIRNALVPGSLGAYAIEIIEPGSIVHACTMPLDDLEVLIRAARDLQCAVSVQLHEYHLSVQPARLLGLLAAAHRIFVSETEFLHLWQSKNFSQAVNRCLSDSSQTWLVTALHRVTIVDGLTSETIRVEPLRAVDPTGAGDVFAGAASAALIATGHLGVAARVGAAVAAIKVLGRASEAVFSALKDR